MALTKIKVQGTGKASGSPDIAIIKFRVQNEDKNLLECRRINNASSELVISLLKEVVAENDLYVIPCKVDPKYKSGLVGKRISGYEGYNIITATIRQLDVVQELVNKISSIDEKVIQISSLQFDLEEKDELENVARRAAFENAKNRAVTYAEQIGSGAIRLIAESIEEHILYGSTARHPSGKFGSVRLHDTNDFFIPSRETLEMGDIELTINATICFSFSSSSGSSCISPELSGSRHHL